MAIHWIQVARNAFKNVGTKSRRIPKDAMMEIWCKMMVVAIHAWLKRSMSAFRRMLDIQFAFNR